MKTLKVTKGPKGTALKQVRKILGDDQSEGSVGPVLASGQGNYPAWAKGDDEILWAVADETERRNGAAFRQYDLTLPKGLPVAESVALVEEFVRQEVGPKPFTWVIRGPLGDDCQGSAIASVMTSDRVLDGFKRRPDQFFRLYSKKEPADGGCRKDGLARLRGEIEDPKITRRRNWANILERAQTECVVRDQ